MTADDRNTCVFCDRERITSDWIEPWADTHDGLQFTRGLAFTPLNPVTPGHIIVAPHEHVTDALEDLTVTGGTQRAAAGFAKRARERGEHHAFNIITSVGAPATQTVRHLHVHVVPRTEGDGLALPWTQQQRPRKPETIARNRQQATVTLHIDPPAPRIVPVPHYPRGRHAW